MFLEGASCQRRSVIGHGVSRGARGGGEPSAALEALCGADLACLGPEPRLGRRGCRERGWPGGRLRRRRLGECVREEMEGGLRAGSSATAVAWPPACVRLRLGRRLALWWLRAFPTGSWAGWGPGGAGTAVQS